MKPIYQALGAALLAFSMASCLDQDLQELNTGSDTLTLSASATDIVLEEAHHADNAIELSWTTGNNFGTGNAIIYRLEIAEAGSNFAYPTVVIEPSQNLYSWRPTVEELNNLIINSMGVLPGDDIALTARVTASVPDVEELQESTVDFTVSTYKEVTSTLYLIGTAAPNGWSADNATELQRIDNGIFEWTGDLKAGEFKFITTLGDFLPSYNNNGQGGLVLRTSDDQPDEKFTVDVDHCYKLHVNLLEGTLTMTEEDGVRPPYDSIFFIGNESDWNFWPLTVDPLDPYLFRIGIFFEKGGDFKFATADGSWENNYKATQPDAPYTDESVEFVSGFDPDNKWLLTDSESNKAYKICLDIHSGEERMMMRLFTPYTEMYLVGDATPNGWDLGNATPMTVDASNPNIFTWTGNLTDGELKFSADRKDDWNGAWFMASSENASPTGTVEKTLFIDKSDDYLKGQYTSISVGDVDLKWKITEAGSYTITLNQLLEEVTIVKN